MLFHDQVFTTFARRGETLIWANVKRDEKTDLVELTTADDSLGILPVSTPRPTSGVFLGYTEGGIEFDPGTEFSEDSSGGVITPYRAFASSEKIRITGSLLFSKYEEALKFLRPLGRDEGSRYRYGGGIFPRITSLFLLVTDDSNPNLAACHYIYRGYFVPTRRNYGRASEYKAISFEYRALRAFMPNSNCYRPGETAVGVVWWINTTTLNETDPSIVFQDTGQKSLLISVRNPWWTVTAFPSGIF